MSINKISQHNLSKLPASALLISGVVSSVTPKTSDSILTKRDEKFSDSRKSLQLTQRPDRKYVQVKPTNPDSRNQKPSYKKSSKDRRDRGYFPRSKSVQKSKLATRELLSIYSSQPDDKKYDLRYQRCSTGELNSINILSLRGSTDTLKISSSTDNPSIIILDYKASPFSPLSQYRINFSSPSANVITQLRNFFSGSISYDSTKNVYKCVDSSGDIFYFGVNVTQALGSAPTYSVFTRIEDSHGIKFCDNSNGFFASSNSTSIATSNSPAPTSPAPTSPAPTSPAPTSQSSAFSTSQASSSQFSSSLFSTLPSSIQSLESSGLTSTFLTSSTQNPSPTFRSSGYLTTSISFTTNPATTTPQMLNATCDNSGSGEKIISVRFTDNQNKRLSLQPYSAGSGSGIEIKFNNGLPFNINYAESASINTFLANTRPYNSKYESGNLSFDFNGVKIYIDTARNKISALANSQELCFDPTTTSTRDLTTSISSSSSSPQVKTFVSSFTSPVYAHFNCTSSNDTLTLFKDGVGQYDIKALRNSSGKVNGYNISNLVSGDQFRLNSNGTLVNVSSGREVSAISKMGFLIFNLGYAIQLEYNPANRSFSLINTNSQTKIASCENISYMDNVVAYGQSPDGNYTCIEKRDNSTDIFVTSDKSIRNVPKYRISYLINQTTGGVDGIKIEDKLNSSNTRNFTFEDLSYLPEDHRGYKITLERDGLSVYFKVASGVNEAKYDIVDGENQTIISCSSIQTSVEIQPKDVTTPSPSPSSRTTYVVPNLDECQMLKDRDNITFVWPSNQSSVKYTELSHPSNTFDLDIFLAGYQAFCLSNSSKDIFSYIDFATRNNSTGGIQRESSGDICIVNVNIDSFNQTKIDKFVDFLKQQKRVTNSSKDSENLDKIIESFEKIKETNRDICSGKASSDINIPVAVTLSVLGGLLFLGAIAYGVSNRNKDRGSSVSGQRGGGQMEVAV